MNQENQNIEHKRIWKDEYLKWVSGFANAHGGKHGKEQGCGDSYEPCAVFYAISLHVLSPRKLILRTSIYSELQLILFT